MRVIAGTLRSRRLLAPAGSATRPTSDRLRETLFNVLAPRVAGARFADFYAGTGAVGIEAISRGAAHVLFTERAPEPLATLRANLRSLGLTSGASVPGFSIAGFSVPGFSVSERSTASTLDRLLAAPAPQPFDLVFLDPPYEAANEYQRTLGTLGSAAAAPLLSADPLVVAEHATHSPLPPRFGRLTLSRTLRQGDATLSFYRLARPDEFPAETNEA